MALSNADFEALLHRGVPSVPDFAGPSHWRPAPTAGIPMAATPSVNDPVLRTVNKMLWGPSRTQMFHTQVPMPIPPSPGTIRPPGAAVAERVTPGSGGSGPKGMHGGAGTMWSRMPNVAKYGIYAMAALIAYNLLGLGKKRQAAQRRIDPRVLAMMQQRGQGGGFQGPSQAQQGMLQLQRQMHMMRMVKQMAAVL